MHNKKTVILRGPILTQSGYSVHTRQFARLLFDYEDNKQDYNIEVICEPLMWGITPWIVDTDALNGMVGRVVQSTKQLEHYDVSVQVQLPNEFNPFLGDYNIGVTAAVETDKCNPDWIDCINKMDLLIVPSEHTKQTLLNSGKEITTKLVVIPESFSDEFIESNNQLLPLNEIKTSFNFLMVAQITGNNPENDRKNIFYTIKWLAEVFKDNPNIGVILKTNLGRNTTLDRVNTQQLLAQLLMEVRKESEFPKFYLIHGDLSEQEMVSLYKHPSVKAFLNLTRSEGFSIPTLEAAVSGLPVIVTNWSGYLDFMKYGKYIKIDYALTPVHESRIDGQIFMKDSKWAFPSEEDAKRKLKKFYEAPQIPTEWAKSLSNIIKEKYSYSAIKKEYYDPIFNEILDSKKEITE